MFVERCRSIGYKVVWAFIDAANLTEEARGKWRERREKEVTDGVRDAMQGQQVLMGQALRKAGCGVFYSLGADNDDTLAYYAHCFGGDVLSNDKDFFRYKNSKFTVYSTWSVDERTDAFKLNLKEKPRQMSEPRDLLSKAPVVMRDPSINEVLESRTYTRGAPSALVRKNGNLHITVRGLRRAVYGSLGVREDVTETFPVWDHEKKAVKWYVERVKPIHHNEDSEAAEWHRLLKAPDEAVRKFEAELGPKPSDVEDYKWNNHRFALRCIVGELCAVATHNFSLLEFMLGSNVDELADTLSGLKLTTSLNAQGRTIKCIVCRREFLFAKPQQDFFKAKGYPDPKKCSDCKSAGRR